MKTAISIPDDTFHRVERRAAALGMSRSEFFVCAAQRYLDHLDAQTLTDRINAALELAGDDDTSRAAVDVGWRRLAADDDEW